MTEPIEPTQGSEPVGSEPTPAPKGGKVDPEIQAIIDKAVTDRLAREKAAHEKEKAALDKEKASLIKEKDELSKKLQGFEDKDLAEMDKLQKKIERLTKELTDKDTELSGAKLKIAKTESLLAAGAMPDQIPKLLKRVAGTTEEEIAADVEELKALGWIGKPPETGAVFPKPAASGSGHPPVSDKGSRTFTRAQLKDPEFYNANRAEIMKALEDKRIK